MNNQEYRELVEAFKGFWMSEYGKKAIRKARDRARNMQKTPQEPWEEELDLHKNTYEPNNHADNDEDSINAENQLNEPFKQIPQT